MAFTLLVIDDELDKPIKSDSVSRRPYYECLQGPFEVVYINSLSELAPLLASQIVHAVLLDFFLEGWSTDAPTVLAQLPKTIPVGLISAQWGPNFDKIRSTLASFPDQISQLFTIDELTDVARRDLIVAWLRHSINRSQDIAITSLGPQDPIRILQLSDIQFGSEPPPALETETDLLAQQVLDLWGGPPTFIALTGDIAQHGLPSEYSNAKAWVAKLAAEMDATWTKDRYLVVPGNHDVCWGLGRATRIDPAADELLPIGSAGQYAELLPFAFSPFRKFASDLMGDQFWSEKSQHWVLSRFRNLGVVVCGINSSEDLNGNSMETRRLTDRTVANLFYGLRTSLKATKDSPPLIVSLMHHPLHVSAEQKGLVNPSIFLGPLGQLAKSALNLCGHVHGSKHYLFSSDDANVLEITASTATQPEAARPKDTLRGFNMIELVRDGARVTEIRLQVCKFEEHTVSAAPVVRYLRDDSGSIRKA